MFLLRFITLTKDYNDPRLFLQTRYQCLNTCLLISIYTLTNINNFLIPLLINRTRYKFFDESCLGHHRFPSLRLHD